jgi:hypothetical protein
LKKSRFFGLAAAYLAASAVCQMPTSLFAQASEEQGKSIGKVSRVDDLILMPLDEEVLGKQNLFDLNRRTVRFIPSGSGYRVENLPLQWDSEFAEDLEGSEVSLRKMKFPRPQERKMS